MKLSKLVYLTVKNTVYLDDNSFTYDEFLKGSFDGSADYGMYINNSLLPINEAIARLNDLDRIQYKIVKNVVVDSDSMINLPNDLKELVGVGKVTKYGIRVFKYKRVGNQAFVFCCDTNKISIEYKQDICFSESDMKYDYDVSTDSAEEINDVELRDYNIDNTMCNYIIEYASAKLSEDVNASVSNLHVNRAEQYFSNITICNKLFSQEKVRAIYRIGE